MIGRRTLIRIAALAGASTAFAASILLPSSSRPHLAAGGADATRVMFKIAGWEVATIVQQATPPPRLSRLRRKHGSVSIDHGARRGDDFLERVSGGRGRAMTTAIKLTVNGEARVLEVDDPTCPCCMRCATSLAFMVSTTAAGWRSARLTVHYYGEALRSCVMPVSAVAGPHRHSGRSRHSRKAASRPAGIHP